MQVPWIFKIKADCVLKASDVKFVIKNTFRCLLRI